MKQVNPKEINRYVGKQIIITPRACPEDKTKRVIENISGNKVQFKNYPPIQVGNLPQYIIKAPQSATSE